MITVRGVSGLAPPVAGDAPRLDLDAVRQLVERVDAREVDGVVVVRLVAPIPPDGWFPAIDELQLMVGRHERRPT